MLDAQVMPFVPLNSMSSGYHYDPPVPNHLIASYKTQDYVVVKHGVAPLESYATLDHDARFHLHDNKQPQPLHNHTEFASHHQSFSGTQCYENLTSKSASLKFVVGDGGGGGTTLETLARLSNPREAKTRYFDPFDQDEEMEEEEDDEDEEEDVDDDEFLQEEYDDAVYRAQMTPDSPTRLLQFIQTVTTQIQSRFTQNRGNEDYCDVYEERFKTTLSGRELYYADLLALASNSEVPSSSSRKLLRSPPTSTTTAINCPTACSTSSPTTETVKRSTDHTVIYDQSGNAKSCTLPHEGRQIAGCGLGPLEELFRCSLAWKVTTLTTTMSPPSPVAAPKLGFGKGYDAPREGGGGREDGGYSLPNVPMTLRKLPSSFWEEPGSDRTREHVILPSVNNTPDFTDLFDQWTDKC